MHARRTGNHDRLATLQTGIVERDQLRAMLKAVRKYGQRGVPQEDRVEMKPGRSLGLKSIPTIRMQPCLLEVPWPFTIDHHEAVATGVGADYAAVGSTENLVRLREKATAVGVPF